MVAALAAGVAVSLLAGTVVALHFGVQADQRAEEAEANEQRAVAEKRTAVGRLYASEMQLAEKAWVAGRIDWLVDLLKGQMPENTGGVDLRGFEWYYWWRRCHTELVTFRGHTGKVTCVAFAPDSRHLASGSADGTVRVWDRRTRQGTLVLRGRGGAVQTVAYRPGGRMLASGAADGTVTLWDVRKGKAVGTLRGHSTAVTGLAFSPDGRLLASASAPRPRERKPGGVKVWDVQVAKQMYSLSGETSVAFRPDGKWIAAAGGPLAPDKAGVIEFSPFKVWDAATGKEVNPFRNKTEMRMAKPVTNVAFTPDGQGLTWIEQTRPERKALCTSANGSKISPFSPR